MIWLLATSLTFFFLLVFLAPLYFSLIGFVDFWICQTYFCLRAVVLIYLLPRTFLFQTLKGFTVS